jgi:hypothetical protein
VHQEQQARCADLKDILDRLLEVALMDWPAFVEERMADGAARPRALPPQDPASVPVFDEPIWR